MLSFLTYPTPLIWSRVEGKELMLPAQRISYTQPFLLELSLPSSKDSCHLPGVLPKENPDAVYPPLKNDGWNTTFLLGRPIFRGELLVSGNPDPQNLPRKNQFRRDLRRTVCVWQQQSPVQPVICWKTQWNLGTLLGGGFKHIFSRES